MPAYHVSRSIMIDAPKAQIKKSLTNFKEWPIWSPWLIMQPDATLNYSGKQRKVGAGYDWSGELVGAGSMEILHIDDQDIEMQLHFLKPFKSKAKVIFTLDEHDGQTEVIWHMYGHLPFLLFWMTSKMETYIGMDYTRGLAMFKEYMQTGTVTSSVQIEGVAPLQSTRYIGIPNTCALEEVGKVMKADFEKLDDFMQKHDITLASSPFSIYNTFDIFKKKTDYVACIPYEGDAPLEEGFVYGTLEGCDAVKVVHTGSYLHMGNGWMSAFSYAKVHKKKIVKKPVGVEFYLNNPDDTAQKDLLTEIYLPLK